MTTRTQIDIYSHIADKWIARYGAVAPGHLEPDRSPYTITHLRGAWLDGWFWVNRKCKARAVK